MPAKTCISGGYRCLRLSVWEGVRDRERRRTRRYGCNLSPFVALSTSVSKVTTSSSYAIYVVVLFGYNAGAPVVTVEGVVRQRF